MRILLLPLAFLMIGAVPPKPGAVGMLGQVRYMLGNDSLDEGTEGSELLALSPQSAEFLAPLDSFEELDRLAFLSHQATQLCGSIDFYPLGYSLAESVVHTPPQLSPEFDFAALRPILAEVDTSKMDQTLSTLTALPSRFHRHATGQNAGSTVKGLWEAEIQPENSGTWQIEEFTHSATPQKSVVARLEGESENETTLVLGAHLDSINPGGGADGTAPGADDDASGIAILTEILRIIETKGLRFHRSIELHGYAAEEIGLVGSRDLAAKYRSEDRSIAGMLQFDMAFYSQAADAGRLFFLEDYTSLDLTRGAIRLTKRYIGDVYERGFLPGGSSSDHKAWFEQGYPTLFPFENPEAHNPDIHTARDIVSETDDKLRMERMVQLGLLFLSYHAGLTSLDAATPAEAERVRTMEVDRDLYLHIRGSDGSYVLQAASGDSAAYLEFCRIDAASDFRCAGARQRLYPATGNSGPKIFQGAADFAKGERYRFEAFDVADELIARRHIQWQ